VRGRLGCAQARGDAPSHPTAFAAAQVADLSRTRDDLACHRVVYKDLAADYGSAGKEGSGCAALPMSTYPVTKDECG